MAVFVEDWGANYGSAYLVTQDDVSSASAELVEDGPDLIAHDGAPPVRGDGAIAFVDGVRRGEASLWQEDSAGRSGRGALAAMRAVPSSPTAQARPSVRAGCSAWSSGVQE